jgi:hypothetical protein
VKTGDEKGSLLKQREVIETAGQLAEMQRKDDQAMPEGKASDHAPADSQISYGNFLGSDPSGDVVDSIRNLQQVLDRHLENIDRNTERAASNNAAGGFPQNP